MAEYETSETGNWNIAENWSNEMIFKPFYECSQYLTIAKRGTSSIEEDFIFDEQTKVRSRINSLEWARDKLEQGIRQSLFAIRNSNDRKKVQDFLKEIVDLDNGSNCPMSLVFNKVTDRDKTKIEINEEMFKIVFNCLKRIFTEVTEPMNRSDLIFNFKEQFDPKKAKKRIKEDFINTG
jgi:hypothetical protein